MNKTTIVNRAKKVGYMLLDNAEVIAAGLIAGLGIFVGYHVGFAIGKYYDC